jgi:signal transduction histidine kinase
MSPNQAVVHRSLGHSYDSSLMPLEGEDAREDIDPDRARWVDVQLIHNFFINAFATLRALLLAVAITVAMLFRYLDPAWLAAWTLAVLAITGYRYWMVMQYRLYYRSADGCALHRFFGRHSWSWAANAAAWSSLSFLYIDKVPVANQYVCLMVLVGIGSFSVSFVASRLDVLKYFLGALCGVLLLSALHSWIVSGRGLASTYDISVCILGGIFWALLLGTGQRFHKVHRRGFELQYDNEHLIASLREQTETAIHAVTVKDRLLANAAHDLRQPVHALAFYADWLRNEPELSAEVVPKILVATDSVNSLFNSLFDFAKIQAGAVQPQYAAVPVCQVIDDMKVQFGPAASHKHLDFRQRITSGYMWTDPLLIRRIVGNLMANAIRYTERGGVLLTTRVRADCMWIEVWDTGVGIAPEHHEHVFQEFYKASVHSGTEDGFGLGLAIVQRLSEVLGHKVSMVSHLGRGTSMRVEVSLAKAIAPG